MQHDQSQAAKKERATGEGGSVSVNEKGGKEVKEAKKKVSFEFPKGAKLGPVIGMEDERGGVSQCDFFCCVCITLRVMG